MKLSSGIRAPRTSRVLPGILLVSVVLAVWFHSVWLTALAEFLVVSTPLEPADVVVVLGGGGTNRLERGIELYRQGFSKTQTLVITGGSLGAEIFAEGSWASLGSKYAHQKGVPLEDIILFDWTESTYDDVQAVREFFEQRGYSSATLVSDSFHLRRVEWISGKVMSGYKVMLSPAPSPVLNTEKWWTREREFLFVTQEYMKLGLYLAKYGL